MPSNKKQAMFASHERHIEDARGRALASFKIACSHDYEGIRALNALKSMQHDVDQVLLWQERLARFRGQEWVPPADAFMSVVNVSQADIQDKARSIALFMAKETLLQAAQQIKRWNSDPELLPQLTRYLTDAGYTEETLDEGLALLGTTRARVETWDDFDDISLLPSAEFDCEQDRQP
jgi:hypothetical protein